MDNTDQPIRPAPIAAPERTVILDVIRGFALGGVFLSNVYVWMSGMIMLPRDTVKEAMSGMLPKVIDGIYVILVGGKFMTMFTFLFGLGLAVQFSRAEERQDSAVKRYVRRCLTLVLFGALHLSLLWYGDITHLYAIIGLFVLLFRNRSTKTLVVWGLILTLVSVPIGMWIQFLLPQLVNSPEVTEAAMAAEMAKEQEFNRQSLAIFQGHSYLAIVRMNVIMYWHHFFNPIYMAYNVASLGNFLLGLAVGRLHWFQDVAAHRQAFKRLLGWSALTSVLSFVIVAVARHFAGAPNPMKANIPMGIFVPILRHVSTLSLALVYMSAITLLYQRDFFRRILSIYAPVGRMAVSNYFAQSAIGLFFFCGIGLGFMGDLRLRWLVGMPLVMFGGQMIFSWIWLRHFRFGPVEWLTRSLTYGKLQPMRIVKSPVSSSGMS
jgi:uncharacterized protein